jgi:hypothetical protein
MEVLEMTETIRYSTYEGTNRLEQYNLQRLAKDILENGEIVSVNHFVFQTNRYSKDNEFESFKDGGKNITVKGFGTTYYIHLNGLKVTEITEIQELV